MTLYSWPSVRNDDSLASSWAVIASANMPVTMYASAPAAATGVNRPSTRNTPAAI